jgi:hypothetical protein
MYRWEEIEVRQSGSEGKGMGVFANQDLAPGLMIPIAGMRIPAHMASGRTHAYVRSGSDCAVDGSPGFNGHRGVGSFGLAIALMANEPDQQQDLNCCFRVDYLMTYKPIAKGSELLVDYGVAYEPIRRAQGYRLNWANADTRDEELEISRRVTRTRGAQDLGEQRRAVLEAVDRAIQEAPSAVCARRPLRKTLVLDPDICYAQLKLAGTGACYKWEQRAGKNRLFRDQDLPVTVNVVAAKYRTRNPVIRTVKVHTHTLHMHTTQAYTQFKHTHTTRTQQ